MSDLQMFGSPLEHHVLECLVFQWDGTKESAMAAVADMQRDLPARDGHVVEAHQRAEAVISGDRESSHKLTLGIKRGADRKTWTLDLHRGDWLVIWLHRERVHAIQVTDAESGEALFRPSMPVVALWPAALGEIGS